MKRVLIGAGVGVACALLLIAGLAAWHGYSRGMDTNRLPPGLHAAVINAFFCVAYLWPVPAACGALFGAAAGYGSWLVRPRR